MINMVVHLDARKSWKRNKHTKLGIYNLVCLFTSIVFITIKRVLHVFPFPFVFFHLEKFVAFSGRVVHGFKQPVTGCTYLDLRCLTNHSTCVFHEVKQHRSRLGPGCVTGFFTSRTIRQTLHLVAAIGGMGDDITIISGWSSQASMERERLHGSIRGSVMWVVGDFGAKSREKGEKCNGNRYINYFYSLVWKPTFIATQVEWLPFLWS